MKILVYTARPGDGCAYYRGMGPWSAFAKEYRDIDVQYCHDKTAWGEIRQRDILFLLRPCQTELKEMVSHAKDFGVKVWVDFDDDLLSLPTDNPGYPYYSSPLIKQNVEFYLREADLVTVSTNHLKNSFLKFTEKIEVLSNSFDTDLLKWKFADGPSNNFVLWRGTRTHDRDVASVAAEIVKAAQKFPAYQFLFFGSDPVPYLCSEKIKNVLRIPETKSVFQYLKTLGALKPALVISPLQDHTFNRSKSCIAAIEAAFAGAPCICPDWEEWQIPGAINYSDPENFGVMLRSYLDSSSAQEQKAKQARAYIIQTRTLKAANVLRKALATKLVGEQ